MKRAEGFYSGEPNPKGVAEIKFNPDNTKAAVFYQDKETHPNPYKLSEFPEFLLKLSPKDRQQLWFVELNNKEKIWQLRPAFGLLETDFVYFAHKENSPPTLKSVTRQYGDDTVTYQEFYAIYTAVDPKYEGNVSTSVTLRFNVREADGFVQLFIKGSWTELLEKWFKVHGIWDLDFQWKDPQAILQDWEKTVLRQGNTKVTHSLENGYSQTWYATQSTSDEPSWDVVEKEVADIWKDDLPAPTNPVENTATEEEFDFGEWK